jgi:hypothetical protein
MTVALGAGHALEELAALKIKAAHQIAPQVELWMFSLVPAVRASTLAHRPPRSPRRAQHLIQNGRMTAFSGRRREFARRALQRAGAIADDRAMVSRRLDGTSEGD